MTRYALFLLLWAAPAWAAGPTIQIPDEIVATGDYVTVTPQTDAKSIVYVGLSGVDAFPSEFLKDSRSFVLPVRGLAQGRYNFRAVGTLNDEQSTKGFAVIVGTPPAPVPVPVPPAPTPTDPFQAALQAAFGVEGAVPKLTQVQTLARFYRTAAATTVNDPTLRTYQDLQNVMKLTIKQQGLPPGALAGLVSIIAADELRAFPNRATPLDPTTRAVAASEFIRIAAALEGIK